MNTEGRTLQIRVNGEPRTAGGEATVADLLRELDVRPDRVAVEVNLEILNRDDFERRRLRDGDRVEILSFIGGGGPEPSAIRRQLVGEGWGRSRKRTGRG